MWRVLSEKGWVGVIWRYDDVEGQFVLYFHVEGNKVSVAFSLCSSSCLVTRISRGLDMY